MRTSILLAVLTLSAASKPLLAQDTGDTQAARAELQADRTKLVAANLQLTDAEAAKFWPLYEEYRGKQNRLDDKALAMIEDYAKNYDNLSDEKAKELIKASLDLEKDRSDLRRSYLGKFEKVLPWKKVARYYQIERKLDAAVQYEGAQAIPLAK
jgi:Spy/CpxP family protein refolding chaperone